MSVFLRQVKLKNGISLVMYEGKYDPITKNTKQKVLKNFGTLEELKNIYVNPIEHFTNVCKEKDKELRLKYKEQKEEKIPRTTTKRYLGYFPIKRLLDKFNFKDEFTFLTLNKKIDFVLNDLFSFLVYSQIINPQSKNKSYEDKDRFFKSFNFSKSQMYDGIKFIGQNKQTILDYIKYQTKNIVKVDTTSTYFDGTNIYFEIDKENDMLKRGPEKNNRHDPIIGLGLLLDNNAIPISYTTFPGNCSEKPELHKNVQNLKKQENIKGRTIIVADKGLNCGDNIYQAISNNDGYVFSQKVKNTDSTTYNWILDSKEYINKKDNDDNIIFKSKSIVGEYPINITSKLNGQKSVINVTQKRVIFWSKDYADKAKFEREKIIAKAKLLVQNPKEYTKNTVGNAAKYIKEINYDTNGEILNKQLNIDYEKISEDEKLDGYYMIVTSETKLPDDKIIDIYRGLWEIEESFSIIKGVLKVRPIFSKSIEAIECHILVSYLSLLILRILQKNILKDELTAEQIKEIEKANRKKHTHKINMNKIGELPIKQIVDFMRSYECIEINNKYFVSEYHDLIPLFEEKYDLVLDKHILESKDIKKIFAL